MEQQANRKYIAIIAFLRKFLSVFFSLFFNIYILKIVNNDLNFILKYTVYSVFLGIILEYILLKISIPFNEYIFLLDRSIVVIFEITFLVI